MDFMDEVSRLAEEAKEKVRIDELKKARFRAKVQKAKETVLEVAPVIIAATPAVVMTGHTVANIAHTVSIVANRRAENVRRERTIYDRSEAHYWNLKRKLTNKDWERINQLKGSGKRLGDILKEMNLLK